MAIIAASVIAMDEFYVKNPCKYGLAEKNEGSATTRLSVLLKIKTLTFPAVFNQKWQF